MKIIIYSVITFAFNIYFVEGINMDLKIKWIITILVLTVLTLSFSISAYILSPVGQSTDLSDKTVNPEPELEKAVFIMYASDYARPDKPDKPGKPGGGDKDEKCYELNRVKWMTTPVNYKINPTNLDSLSEAFVTSAVQASSEVWDAETTDNIFNTPTINYAVRQTALDNTNLVFFSDTFTDDNIIGVCTYWYYRGGKIRQLVEFDIELNDYWQWGNNPSGARAMDLQGIVTHEFGHAYGLGDIYTDPCIDVTMYGIASDNGYNKRTLEPDDITGITEIYG
jgi:hypothetical protein